MKKIKKLCIVIIGIFTFSMCFTTSTVKAKEVKYKDNNGVKSVDIIELAKAMNLPINKNGNNIEITINNKKLSFNDEDSYVYIDNKIITLNYTTFTDENSSKEYKLPTFSRITKDGDGYLFPVEFVETYLGVQAGENSIEIKDDEESKKETSNEDNKNVTTTVSENNESNQSEKKKTQSNKTSNKYYNTSGNNGNQSSERNEEHIESETPQPPSNTGVGDREEENKDHNNNNNNDDDAPPSDYTPEADQT